MAERGAEELWGLDLSSTQIETAHETLQSESKVNMWSNGRGKGYSERVF